MSTNLTAFNTWIHHGVGADAFWALLIALIVIGIPVGMAVDRRVKARRAAG